MTTDTELRQPAPSGTDLPTRAALSAVVSSAVEGRALLTHPFYQRWEAGHLAPEELAEYAVHYRAFEAALPAVLGAVADRLVTEGKPDVAALVASNLADELGVPEPHLALFDRFAEAWALTPAAGPGRRPRPSSPPTGGWSLRAPIWPWPAWPPTRPRPPPSPPPRPRACGASMGSRHPRTDSGTSTPPWTPTTATGPLTP